ncbi:MAG: polyphosphate kinase 2 family protein [Chloroflexota bacterium]|nr:MAG: polyphosphate kinase 2 family protein [Chloroflexota bacterium]
MGKDGKINDYRVDPGSRVDLSEWDPEDDHVFPVNKQEGKEMFRELAIELGELQEILFAEHKHRLLVVLQAMDTGGKDGTISHVFEFVNPQGVHVASFKAPSALELDHDYLWRVHAHTPGKGEITIFNRSHYEDVLIVRVHDLAPKEVWRCRYRHINEFEHMLADEGTTIVKFYLNIDKDEQKERLQARLDDPTKHWKFNPDDLKERELWPDYIKAYEDVLSKTSTDWAPWYVVPSNRKWYRNLVVASVLVNTLKDLNLKYPEPKTDLSKIVIDGEESTEF